MEIAPATTSAIPATLTIIKDGTLALDKPAGRAKGTGKTIRDAENGVSGVSLDLEVFFYAIPAKELGRSKVALS